MHEVLVNRLGGLSLPRKSVVRLTDRPDMTLDVYRGRKTTMQQQQSPLRYWLEGLNELNDPKGRENIICTMIMYRETFYYRHTPWKQGIL